MKKLLPIFLGFLSFPHLGLANYQACKIDVGNKFNVSESIAGDLCQLNSTFIQQCMTEQSELQKNRDFILISEICLNHLNQTNKSLQTESQN